MARICGVSDAAMRQHLEQLEVEGLVCRDFQTSSGTSRGRPAAHWVLNQEELQSIPDIFPEIFPDRHPDLAVDLLVGIAEYLRPEAMRTVLGCRGERLAKHYQNLMVGLSLAERVNLLADARDAEGFRAESSITPDGSLLLTEHHCAIA